MHIRSTICITLVIAASGGGFGCASKKAPAPGSNRDPAVNAGGSGSDATETLPQEPPPVMPADAEAPPIETLPGAANQPGDPQMPQPPGEPPPANAGPVYVTWLGTAGLFVTDGQSSFLIDPFVSRYGMARVIARFSLESRPELVDSWIQKVGVPPKTPVIVTHSHYDHVLDAPTFVQKLGGKLVGSASTINVGLGAGLKQEQMLLVHAGAMMQIGAFKLRWIGSCHGAQFAGIELWSGEIEAPLEQPTSAARYKVGEHFSVVVEHPNARFLHQSSACVVPKMYDGTKVDTAFLGIASRTSTLEIIDPLVAGTGAKRIVPIHFDDFFAPLDEPMDTVSGVDLEEFYETIKTQRPETSVTTLEIGVRWQHP